MDKWQANGLMIAESNTIEKNKLGWKVPSQSGNGTYIVNTDDGEPFCTCQHFGNTHEKCQHIYAVEFIEKKEEKPDGTVVTTKAMRVTYSQDWSIYNEAQMHEQEHFVRLLRDLCDTIPQPEQTFGRPKLPLSDVVFGIVSKVYSTMSGRRFMSDLKVAEANEFIDKSPSFTSIFRYLEKPELTPLLKDFIEQSAMPLKSVETDFAVDSSGFASTVYNRWFDHKWGKMRREVKWIKAHLMCGVKTHVVTSAEVHATETADSPQFIKLFDATSKTFKINEVSADKAYSSKHILRAIDAVNGTSYIPFKSYSKGEYKGHKPYCELWHRMWHFYMFNREEFLQHYHKRSNAETTFYIIKTKFGANVRAKTPTAQINEVLCKILCHNICVLIQSIYELGITPTFLLN